MRQLFISDDTTVAYSSGVLATGAVDIQKKDSNGEVTSLVIGDSFQDAPEIRLVQGSANGNIFGPWIKGKNVLSYDGRANVPQVAKIERITFASNTTTNGTVDIKIIRRDVQPQEMFKISTYIDFDGGTNTPAEIVDENEAQCVTMKADGNWPEWLSTTVTNSGGATIDFKGQKDGETTNSGETWDEGVSLFEISTDLGELTGTTVSDATQTEPTMGTGSGYQVNKFEDSLMGSAFGYYNRVKLPNTPTGSAVVGTAYDMYSVVATKDGSTSPQIKGVDNLVEMYIATVAGEADAIIVEQKLNGYFAGVFDAVTL